MANRLISPAALGIATIICLIPFCAADEKIITEKVPIPKTTVEFVLVKIPAGKITMKDKAGKKKVVEIKPFWIGKTEVTWDEYDVFCLALDLPENERHRSEPSDPLGNRPGLPYAPPGWPGHAGFPAGGIPFQYAKNYCDWLSKATGKKYRLPTEAEWEYACRAGDKAQKLEKDRLDKSAWYSDNCDDQTHPVAKKEPNNWGLYDTLGNVAEWVIMSDGTGAVAGGSFDDEAEKVTPGTRAVYDKRWQRRDPRDPKHNDWYFDAPHVGFRIVRED